MAPRLPDQLRKVLLSSGMPWRIDTGTRHFKLIIGDRLAAVLPKSGRLSNFSGRADKNTVAQVRRVIRQSQGAHNG